MAKALVINPNTSPEMSRGIRSTAERVFQAPWSSCTVNAPAGPESLESWRDYQLAGVASMPLLRTPADVDGVVLACFGDPGLFAMKEMTRIPVVGIGEAALSMALLLGGRFGILAGMGRAVGLMDAMVRSYGLESRYAGTTALEVRVATLERDPEATLDLLTRAATRMLDRGADVLVLGCAGLTTFSAPLAARIPFTIIDPVEAGCRMLKAVVESGLNVSRLGLYSRPAAQPMHDPEALFSPEMAGFLKNWESAGGMGA